MAGDVEICGFLDVKLPRCKYVTQSVKKRSLTPWKAWKRQWCSVKKLGPGLGVEIQLNYTITGGTALIQAERHNGIPVPPEVTICRTPSRSKQFAFGIFPVKERKSLIYLSGNSETETQQWMTNIRKLLRPRKFQPIQGSHSISIIDNAHSMAAGLTGLYGDLIVSPIGIHVKDIHSGDIIENFTWKQMGQFHLSTTGRPEDVKRICVICTTKEFCAGIGELQMFCLDANRLLQDLVTQGRGPKHKHSHRSLSLSEGDLRMSINCEEVIETFPLLKDKNVSSLVNIQQEALFSLWSNTNKTAGASTSDQEQNVGNRIRAVDNVYQPEPPSIPNIEPSMSEILCNRRVSNISVASGIYEEILDCEDVPKPRRVSGNLYEDPEDVILNSQFQMQPPPLPPRQRCKSDSVVNPSMEDQDDMKLQNFVPMKLKLSLDSKTSHIRETITDTSDYIPMSPRLKDVMSHKHEVQTSSQEDVYIMMR